MFRRTFREIFRSTLLSAMGWLEACRVLLGPRRAARHLAGTSWHKKAIALFLCSPAFGGHPASIVPAAYSSVPKTGQNRRTSRPHLALRGTTCTRRPLHVRVHARSKDLWDRHVVPSRARRCNGCRSPRRGSPWFPRPGRRVRCGRASGLEVPARLATPTWLHGFRWQLSRSNQCRRP